KKIILYAPTYRDNGMDISNIALNLEKLYTALSDNYVLFIRMHPTVQTEELNYYPDFIVNVSGETDLNALLVCVDILVTDYSSIPFEFALLHKPIIFYAYDLNEYAKTRGFWDLYEDVVPGPIVKTTDEIINVIHADRFHMKQISV